MIQRIAHIGLLLFALLAGNNDLLADMFGTAEGVFTYPFVSVNRPGNTADNWYDLGAVGYRYRIGKYEISREMIGFANAAGRLDIALDEMDFLPDGPTPKLPATGVSWNEAARFVNWLNESQGYPPAYQFPSQPGDASYSTSEHLGLWSVGSPEHDAMNPFRNKLAHYFLPSASEWHKAAYFDPTANAGAGEYRDYPTGGQEGPVAVSNGTDDGTAVFDQGIDRGPAEIDLAGGVSIFGAMGMGGNVTEFDESTADQSNDSGAAHRGVRGGYWADHLASMHARARVFLGTNPNRKLSHQGFRIAATIDDLIVGDFDGDGELTITDIDMLSDAVFRDLRSLEFDVNMDNRVSEADRTYWIDSIKRTWPGDANLDGEFSSTDLVGVFQFGQYEDLVAGQSTWATGDWNNDREFNSSDLVYAFQVGGYESGARGSVSVVPEPSCSVVTLIVVIAVVAPQVQRRSAPGA